MPNEDTIEQVESSRGRKLNHRQRKLVLLLLEAEAGKMTIKEAMLKAGYAEESARQQKNTLDNLRSNTAMQEALRKAGFTEDLIAQKIMEGLDAERTYPVREGDEVRLETAPDMDVQHKFLKTGAELLDAFPAQKSIQAQVGIEQLLDDAEAGTDHPGQFQA